jgi:hypothetical protein
VHLGTLIAVLGPDVDIADLQKRLRCPSCGTDRIELRIVQPPSASAGANDAKRARRRMRPAEPGRETLGTCREPWIVFTCSKCNRRGELRREKLVEEFCSEVSLPSLLAIFAHSRGCGLAIPQPRQLDLARDRECKIRYDVEG